MLYNKLKKEVIIVFLPQQKMADFFYQLRSSLGKLIKKKKSQEMQLNAMLSREDSTE